MANVSPLLKLKVVTDLTTIRTFRPVILVTYAFKLAEDFVVVPHVKPAILKVVGSNQIWPGVVPKSSTTQALIDMIHWSIGTDWNGSKIRTILFDYRKAFECIDYTR